MKELNIFSFWSTTLCFRKISIEEALATRDWEINELFLFDVSIGSKPGAPGCNRHKVSGFQSFQNVSDVILVVTRRASILGDTSKASIKWLTQHLRRPSSWVASCYAMPYIYTGGFVFIQPSPLNGRFRLLKKEIHDDPWIIILQGKPGC